MQPVATAVQVLVGLLVTFLLGTGVKPLLEHAKKSMPLTAPSEALASQWERLTSGNEGGVILGRFERFLFFCAFWAHAEAVIAAWLAFKVASKWNAWTNVVAVPKEVEGIDAIEFLIARRKWGSHVLMTFLLGTLANVVAGFIGALVARHGYPLAKALFG